MGTDLAMTHRTKDRPTCAAARGFTLIEVLITVAIVAILAAIAYPSYQEQVIRSNRAAAQAHLMDLAQRQQAFLVDARRYAATLLELGAPDAPRRVADHYEAITITADPANPRPDFTLTATPKAGTIQVKDPAGAMTLNEAGVKTPAQYW